MRERNKIMTRFLALTTLVAWFAGCATTFQVPTATVWAYAGYSQVPLTVIRIEGSSDALAVALGRIVGWAPGYHMCTSNRIWDGGFFQLIPGPSTTCREARVEPGSDWWAFISRDPNFGMAFTTLEKCERIRALPLQWAALSPCSPVSVHFVQ